MEQQREQPSLSQPELEQSNEYEQQQRVSVFPIASYEFPGLNLEYQ